MSTPTKQSKATNKTQQPKRQKKAEAVSFSKWFLLPPALMMALVPLLMHYYEYMNHLSDFGWIIREETSDFFLFYKMVAIIILGVVMLCIIAGRLFIDGSKVKFSTAFIPMLVYALFIIISAVASQYPVFVNGGIREQFEPVWVLLSYCIMAYYCFLFINNEKDVENIFFWLFIGSAVIALIGTCQFLNGKIPGTGAEGKVQLDIFRSELGGKILLPRESWGEKLDFTFPEGRAYVTLYNPNYVGMYVSLVTPCLAAFMVTRKKRIHLIACAVLMAGLLVTLYSAGAKNGIIALLVTGILYAAAYRRAFLKRPLICIGGLAVVIAFFFISNHALNNAVINGIKGAFTHKDNSAAEAKLEKIETRDEDVVIFYGGNELHLSSLVDEASGYLYVQAVDQDGVQVEYNMNTETGVADFLDQRFEGICVFTTMADGVDVTLLGVYIDDGSIADENFRYFYFSNQVSEDGGYYNYNSVGNFVKMQTSETGPFADNPDMFSGRGYLWSKTIPLLKQYAIVGSGPDTFEVAFPQNDAVSMRQGGYGGMVITKPHNLFLQIGVNTGVVSLLGFLGFYIIYFVWSFKLFFLKRPVSYMDHMGIGIVCGTFGYIISGIINDSTVCVAPVYWCLMGIGYAINVYCENERKRGANIVMDKAQNKKQ